jgi:sugar phosphate isomerase/epimerase
VPPEVILSTASFFPNTELGFRMAAECGYDGVEVMVNHDRRSQTAESVRDLATAYGVPVRSVHVPCLVITQHVWGWSPQLKLRKSVEMALAVDAGVVVVHPPFRWQREYADAFAALVDELDDAEGRVRVTVENMYTVEAMGRRVDPYRWTEEPGLDRFAALTLDTSHAAAARHDLLELYAAMRGRVQHVHLSDSTATKGDEHLPPGHGVLPLQNLAGALVADDFAGHVVLEVGIGRLPEGTRTAVTKECCEWARVAFNR